MATSISNALTTWAPGTAPVTIKNRYFKWRPRDFNANAVPRGSAPSASLMTQTTAAINALFGSGEVCEFERGTYFCNGSLSPCNRDFNADTGKQIWFNDTTFRAVGATADFRKITGQDGEADLSGLNDANDNLPAGEDARVFFDVTGCLYYNYNGKLNLHGNDIARLAGIATSPTSGGQGPQGSCWDTIIISNFKYGVFGTPIYGGNRARYSGVLVGNQIKRLRTYDCTYHLLMGGNTIDDCSIGQFNPIYFASQTSLIYGAALVCNAIYTNGISDQAAENTWPVGLDIQDTNLHVGTFYAEEAMHVPLIVRKNSQVTIQGMKHGAGGQTVMALRTCVYFPDNSGSGTIIAHQRTGEAASDNISPSYDPNSLVLVKAVNTGSGGDQRNIEVKQNYPDSDCPPFAIEASSGGTISKTGVFTSRIPGGNYGYRPNGSASMASPNLSAVTSLYVPA